MIKYTLLLLFILPGLAVYSQQTFTISGNIYKSRPTEPADSSVIVNIYLDGQPIYKTFADKNGRYNCILSDSLNGKKLTIDTDQDETRMIKEHFDGPCPTDCMRSVSYGGTNQKFVVHLDSTRDYHFDLYPFMITRCGFVFPNMYFKKNELQPITLSIDVSSDSALCTMFHFLKCNSKWVIEISAHCSPDEKDKQNLSIKRGQFVKDELVKLGINPKRMVVKGYADTHPPELKDENGTVTNEVPKYEIRRRAVFALLRRDFKE